MQARPLHKGETEAEMEGAEGLVVARAGIDAVIETHRTDRQIVASPKPTP